MLGTVWSMSFIIVKTVMVTSSLAIPSHRVGRFGCKNIVIIRITYKAGFRNWKPADFYSS